MTKIVNELKNKWLARLSSDHPTMNIAKRQSIVNWLLGTSPARLEQLTLIQLAIAEQGMDYRYRILQQRYLDTSPILAYRRLMNRLSSLTILSNKIRTWVALSRDRQRTVIDVLQEIIQEMLSSDHYLQQQLTLISNCTSNHLLRDNLLLASLEEYCLRQIYNQPLIAHRFVNFLRSQSRGGITQVPRKELVRLVSDDPTIEEDFPLSITDIEALNSYQELEKWEETKALRLLVQQEFENHLAQKIGSEALDWFRLYLQGFFPEEISQKLNLPIKKIYQLRDKIRYHALCVFALKTQPELVDQWLEISLQEHNLGLTPKQWQIYWEKLTEQQRLLIIQLKDGNTIEQICTQFNWKKTQGIKEWRRVYLAAQEVRTGESEALE